MKLLRTRPRRLAVALFALGGTVIGVGGAVMPAKADENAPPRCSRVSVWTYRSQQGEDYAVDQQCVTPAWWPDGLSVPVGYLDDTQPPGTTTGAGVKVWVNGPPV